MSEAAQILRIPISRVRRLCRVHEANPGVGLEFRWSANGSHRDINGHLLRGHRLPFADAVNDLARTRDAALRHQVGTVSMGEAAETLGVSVPQVRKLCKLWEEDHSRGLRFAWTEEYMTRPDVGGYTLRGHRRPYADAVQAMAEAKRRAEQDS